MNRKSNLDKICYCLFNPASALLVRTGGAWPGLWLGPALIGEPIAVERPKKYFRRKGRVPGKVTLQITKPPGFDDYSDEEFAALVAERLKELEDEKAAEVKAAGKRFMGPAAIMRQNWKSAPKSSAPRRCLDPHIAAKDTKVRIAALERLTSFWDDHTAVMNRRIETRWRAWTRAARGTDSKLRCGTTVREVVDQKGVRVLARHSQRLDRRAHHSRQLSWRRER